MSDELFTGEFSLFRRLRGKRRASRSRSLHLYSIQRRNGVALIRVELYNRSLFVNAEIRLSESNFRHLNNQINLTQSCPAIPKTEAGGFMPSALQDPRMRDEFGQTIQNRTAEHVFASLHELRRSYLRLLLGAVKEIAPYLPNHPYHLDLTEKEGDYYFFSSIHRGRREFVRMHLTTDFSGVLLLHGSAKATGRGRSIRFRTRRLEEQIKPPIELDNNFGHDAWGRQSWQLPTESGRAAIRWAAVEILKSKEERRPIYSGYENFTNRQIESGIHSCFALKRLLESPHQSQIVAIEEMIDFTRRTVENLRARRVLEIFEKPPREIQQQLRRLYPGSHPLEIDSKLAQIFGAPPALGTLYEMLEILPARRD